MSLHQFGCTVSVHISETYVELYVSVNDFTTSARAAWSALSEAMTRQDKSDPAAFRHQVATQLMDYLVEMEGAVKPWVAGYVVGAIEEALAHEVEERVAEQQASKGDENGQEDRDDA